jgi:bifunctional DNA-binding transcriptional regulator/antitoxin component of YhaV-PrlF toxin-antitoxin module
MTIRKVRQENLVHVDSKGRVVLPREVRRSGLYAVEMNINDEIILRPRIAVDPREVINKRTLGILDESMQNLTKGKAGEHIDLSGFSDEGVTKGGRDEQKITSRQKKLRRK